VGDINLPGEVWLAYDVSTCSAFTVTKLRISSTRTLAE